MVCGGQAGVLSIALGMMCPAKGGVGVERTRLSGNSAALGEPGAPRICCAAAGLSSHLPPKVVARAALEDDTNNCRRFIVRSVID
jgi:hypothetical protein